MENNFNQILTIIIVFVLLSAVVYYMYFMYEKKPKRTELMKENFSNANNYVHKHTSKDLSEDIPIIYDRPIATNRNSRLRSHGDKIRGDLPIIPLTGNWFVPSVDPERDLEAGAINVLAGVDNRTNKQLSELMRAKNGTTIMGGIDLNINQY